jgi:hypothetical protein
MNVMKTKSSKSTRRGFSTTRTMVNVALVGVAMLSSGSFGLTSWRKLATMASYPTLNHQAQNASSRIAQDIRRSSSVDSATPDRLVLNASVGGRNSSVTYVYNAAARTLTRLDVHGTQTILTDIDSFSFSLFQRPTAGAAYGEFQPASANEARLVGCHWSCSRKLAKAKLDSESVELAPVVLRNHC